MGGFVGFSCEPWFEKNGAIYILSIESLLFSKRDPYKLIIMVYEIIPTYLGRIILASIAAC